MTNEIQYKVLWVDDEFSIVQPLQAKAEDYNIDLCHVSNWKDAEQLLNTQFEDFSAIILDAHCKMDNSNPEESSFIHKVLPELEKIFGKKQEDIPWYILSAGTMDGFYKAMDIAQYNRTSHDNEWGKMVYSKTSPSHYDNSEEKLFENIIRVASNKISNIILSRYQETFKYLGDGRLLGKEAYNIMMKMLCNFYYPEKNPHFEFQGNPLRKIMEYLFRAAHKVGLLPTECFEKGGQLNLLDANRFMSGISTKYSKLRYGKESDMESGKESDKIFPDYLGKITKNILNFASVNSHTGENNEYTIDDNDLTIGENEKELFFSYVLQLCHVIKFFGHFVERHPDKEDNLRMIKKVSL